MSPAEDPRLQVPDHVSPGPCADPPAPPTGAEPGDCADQLAQIAAAAGGLAHEIRNPLSTFKLNLDLLAEDWRGANQADPELGRRSLLRLETLRSEAVRLGHILDDFLRLVRGHELLLERRDLNETIRESLDFYEPQAVAHGVYLRHALWAEPIPCRMDAGLIKQALLNLFVNAQQAMPDGGDLIVRTSVVDDQVQVDVADTGRGVEPEKLDRMFEAYFSTKPGGTGLGLAITRRIIEDHAGTITAVAGPDGGTNFTIRLPMS